MSNDPRGPRRTIKSVDCKPEATYIRFVECDHVGEYNQIYTYHIGDSDRCFRCRNTK